MPIWTESQSEAIKSRGKTLLVSAGAGSGKTTVLTSRIIDTLTDPDNPRDISRLLIVTFTKAAASELRERIAASLKKALAIDPTNRRLASQQNSLSRAKICTIDSFCAELVRRNFDALGLPASVRVADEAEMKTLRAAVMEDVINFYYDANGGESDIADFVSFSDNFVTDRDDLLSEAMAMLYEKTSTMPRGVDFISDCALKLREINGANFSASCYGEAILRVISDTLDYFAGVYANACEHFTDGDVFEKKYLPAFRYDADFIDSLKKTLSESWQSIGDTLNLYARPRLTAVKSELQDFDCAVYRAARDDFNKYIAEIKAKFFSYSPEDIYSIASRTAGICEDLHKLLKRFSELYTAEKLKRGAIDFDDLERLCYDLLVRDGKPTDEAKAIAESFDEIYIDEYQDTNGLQDGIFSAISSSDNRFMVGDVKQSIYGFRGAIPEIFSHYRDTLGQDGDQSGKTIFMSDNFRCDKNIIDFTNIISGTLFKTLGNVRYYDGDALIHAKTDDDAKAAPVEVAVIEPADDTNDESNENREVSFVCEKIRALVSEGYRPRDIVILMRSAKSSAAVFEDALSRLSLPCFNTVTRDFFANAEILLMLCLLNCVDNPSRDIYLTGALKSPLFGVTLDELVRIRRFSTEGSLYDALRAFTAETGFTKGERFLSALERYRSYAKMRSVDKLIWYIYTDTGITASVYGENTNGKNLRRANLMLLYNYARDFEKRSFHGLYSFICYVNDIIAERESFPTASLSGEEDDAVRIMTVHQSKGLEFPVVFLCGTGKAFNTSDSRSNLLFGRELGCAVKLRDKSGFARFDTPIRCAVSNEIAEDDIAEETRILYVALTRARERLIITALNSDPDALIESCMLEASRFSTYTLSHSPTYIKWILTALNLCDYTGFCTVTAVKNNDSEEAENEKCAVDIPDDTERVEEDAVEPDRAKIEEYKREIERRFSFVYPHEALTRLPAKLTVSKLYPGVLDEDDTDESKEIKTEDAFKRPMFMELSPQSATAAQRGTATHVFMQFADFGNVERSGVDEEISRLVTQKFITSSDASLIYRDQVERFFDSDLYREIKASSRLWREMRFNIRFPADRFTSEPEKKKLLEGEFLLVQGVIDCFFIADDGSVTLCDYKTDYISPKKAKIPGAAQKLLAERHGLQLSYYRAACERITGLKVGRVIIYAFSISDTIELPLSALPEFSVTTGGEAEFTV